MSCPRRARDARISAACRRRIKSKDREPGREAFDLLTMVRGPGGPFGPIQEFHQHDCRDAQAVGFLVEAHAQPLRTFPQHPDAEVRIQHVAQHQSGSRSCGGGWSRSGRSVPGAAKKSCQIASRGTMICRFPCLRMGHLADRFREGDVLAEADGLGAVGAKQGCMVHGDGSGWISLMYIQAAGVKVPPHLESCGCRSVRQSGREMLAAGVGTRVGWPAAWRRAVS